MALGFCMTLSEGPATAQGKPAQPDKGINKAFQVVPAQAQSKLLIASQKGKHNGQTHPKGRQAKGKGKS